MTTVQWFLLAFSVCYVAALALAIRHHNKKMKEAQAAFDALMAELNRMVDEALKKP